MAGSTNRKGSQTLQGGSLGRPVNQPIFVEDLLCLLCRVVCVRESWFFPRNQIFFQGDSICSFISTTTDFQKL